MANQVIDWTHIKDDIVFIDFETICAGFGWILRSVKDLDTLDDGA